MKTLFLLFLFLLLFSFNVLAKGGIGHSSGHSGTHLSVSHTTGSHVLYEHTSQILHPTPYSTVLPPRYHTEQLDSTVAEENTKWSAEWAFILCVILFAVIVPFLI